MKHSKLFGLAGALGLVIAGCGDVGSKPATNVSTGPGVDIRNSGTGPGGGGGFGGSGYSTGIDRNKDVNELSGAEVQQACSGFLDYVLDEVGEQEILEFSCSISGFFDGLNASTDAEAQMVCVDTRDQCIAEGQNQLDFGCPLEDAIGCSGVTVGQFEDCTNAQVKLVQDNLDTFACTNATVNPQNLDFFDDEIPECAPIDNCDDAPVVEGGGTDGMVPPGGG